MHRFFLPPECITADRVVFPEETARQVSRVLRLLPGEHVVVLDNKGGEFEVSLEEVNHKNVSGGLVESRKAVNEAKVHLTLFICLTQREKFEWILQKCTEIGVSRFVPVISSRSLVQQGKDMQAKKPRWEKILKEAAEQSGRGRIPALSDLIRIETLGENNVAGGQAFVLWEHEQETSLRKKLREIPLNGNETQVSLLVGPEGGFSDNEILESQSAGFIPVSLGQRILRMETAAVVSSALVLYEAGDLE